MNLTKIVCTIGPASSSPKMIERLARAGMNVARLNFSHGSREEKAAWIRRLRAASARTGLPVAVLQDLAGPKIRTGLLADGPVHLDPGAAFTLTARRVPGDAREVSVSYAALPDDVRAGDPILLSDGALELAVESVSGPDIRCRVVVGGELHSRKGINLPGRAVRAPALTDRDRKDLEFGLARGVDWVALSFVRRAEDVLRVRRRMKRLGREAPLIAKIEKHEAVENLDELLDVVDGLMIARGDLGVEIPLEDVPRVQKSAIEKANRAGKPVITATQMLKSMTESPRPTRAEVADVANAVLDGTDAVMLSEETAVGRYPEQAVRLMARVAARAEADFPDRSGMRRFRGAAPASPQEAVARAACDLATAVGAAAILTCTQSGSTTRWVSKYRPPMPILALSPDETTCRRLALVWGAIPARMASARSADGMERRALARARELGAVRPGQTVVITAGMPLRMPGTTNMVRVVRVP